MIGTSRVSIRVFSAMCVGILFALSTAIGSSAAPVDTPRPSPLPTAASDVNDDVITYQGTGTVLYDEGSSTTTERTFGADCSAGTCTSFMGAGEKRRDYTEVVDGRAVVEISASGDPCLNNYVFASTSTYLFTGEGASFHQVIRGPGLVTCPDGTQKRVIGAVITVEGTLVSGNPCFIFNTCPTQEPIAAPIPITVPPDIPAPTFATPGVLSSLPTAATGVTMRNALWATAMAVILLLLLAFPTQLLNSAAERGSERLAQWGAKFAATTGGSGARLRTLASRITSVAGWGAATIGIVAAAIIASFVDPGFGLNAAGIRAFLSILVSLGLQIFGGWLLLIWLVKRTHPHATAEFEFRPLTLLIVAGAVILTRVTGFEPGIIFGLVAGVGFGAILATAERARVALIGLGLAFTMSVVAWLGYSVLNSVGNGGPVVLFLTETLSALAITGIASLPIALLPFKGMTGRIVWDWDRRVWAAAYAVGLIGFFLILMPMPFSWGEVPMSLPLWIGLFVVYAVGAVIAWALIVQPWRKDKADDAVPPGGVLTAAAPSSSPLVEES